MKIIFDLDYTLMDSELLHSKLAEVFDQENYRADYQECFKKKGINFDGDKYLEILKSHGRIDDAREKELKLKLDEMLRDISSCLRPGVEELFKNLREKIENQEKAGQEKDELILITFGNKEWQKRKVENLSIKDCFDRIAFEEKGKDSSEYLKSLSGGEETLIVNDNYDEMLKMKNILGENTRVCLVKGKYNGSAEPDIEELGELVPIIEGKLKIKGEQSNELRFK